MFSDSYGRDVRRLAPGSFRAPWKLTVRRRFVLPQLPPLSLNFFQFRSNVDYLIANCVSQDPFRDASLAPTPRWLIARTGTSSATTASATAPLTLAIRVSTLYIISDLWKNPNKVTLVPLYTEELAKRRGEYSAITSRSKSQLNLPGRRKSYFPLSSFVYSRRNRMKNHGPGARRIRARTIGRGWSERARVVQRASRKFRAAAMIAPQFRDLHNDIANRAIPRNHNYF